MPKKEYMFEKVTMRSYKIKSDSNILYRIYKDAKEFIDIPSSSITEAIATSHVESPLKIEILMPKKRKYFEKNELEEVKIEELSENNITQEISTPEETKN